MVCLFRKNRSDDAFFRHIIHSIHVLFKLPTEYTTFHIFLLTVSHPTTMLKAVTGDGTAPTGAVDSVLDGRTIDVETTSADS